MTLTIIRVFLLLNILSGVDALLALVRLVGATQLEAVPYLLLNVPYLILAFLLLLNSYGYWKLKIWAYYFTFSQIALSLLFFHTSLSFLSHFEHFSNGPIFVYSLKGISLSIEIGKCFLFIMPSVRQLFKNKNSSTEIVYWRRFAVWSNIVLFLFILVLTILRFKI